MSNNNTFQNGYITRSDRETLVSQKGAAIWFTGISGSGKSSIAIELEKRLYERGILSYRLDGDNLRLGINNNLGFSEEDRSENVRRVGEMSKILCDVGILVLSSLISPYSSDRDKVKALHEDGGINFIEVFVDCSVEGAEQRDPKGLYSKARANKIKNFTGVDHPYEAPVSPDLHFDTELMSLEQEVSELIECLIGKGIIGD